MTLFHIILLAVIQGITEFLPISSSGHLALFPMLTGWKDQGLTMDVAVHVGTLGAVILYLWRDVGHILGGLGLLVLGRWTPGARLFFLLVLSTIPVVIAGYLMKRYLGTNIRNAEVIAWASIGFGLLLYVVDKTSMTLHKMDHITWFNALAIGLAQVLALIPGTSRAGITMTAARFFGFERTDAARFSMLMSIPVIVAAGALSAYDLRQSGDIELQRDVVLGIIFSFVAAIVAIMAMMAWLRRATFTPFVIYRVLLGIGILYWVYFLAAPSPA